MPFRIVQVALIALITLLASQATIAQDDNHRVKPNEKDTLHVIKVVNAEGADVAGAEIQLVNSKWQGRSAKSNKVGRADFSGVTPGRYELVVAARGYQTFRQQVNIQATKTTEVEAKLLR